VDESAAGDAVAMSDDALIRQCSVETFRASGPGGQHRNKIESAVRLTHRPTGVAAQAFERRSQHENRILALKRLRATIALRVRRPADPAGTPSPALKAILPGAPQRIGPANPKFWPGVQALLDLFVHTGCSVSETAAALGISTGALVRLLQSSEDLFAECNRLRSERGLRPLRRA
jgi:hypothetical protein